MLVGDNDQKTSRDACAYTQKPSFYICGPCILNDTRSQCDETVYSIESEAVCRCCRTLVNVQLAEGMFELFL